MNGYTRSRLDRTSSHGFTLLELMVSVVIFSFLMLAIVTVWQSSVTLYTRGSMGMTDMRNARAAIELVSAELRTMLPPLPASISTQATYLHVIGTSNTDNGNDKITYYSPQYNGNE